MQDEIFLSKEGNNYFGRNKSYYTQASSTFNNINYAISLINNVSQIKSVLDLGCANGNRLDDLKQLLPECNRFVGIEASADAINDGKKRYKDIELHQGVLSDIPIKAPFDLVIINFVLHWVDRSSLIKSISEIDRVVKNNGYLIIGDFLPDCPLKRKYGHLPEDNVYTYKQDYSKIFESSNMYKEIYRFVYDHDIKLKELSINASDNASRAYCSVLKKDINNYYRELL